MIVLDAVRAALLVFFVLLLFRMAMEWVFLLFRSYRPRGFMAMALEITYSATDPPYRALRRVIPPLRLGGFGLDIAFMVLIFVVIILLSVIP